jgi:hypothetical protein
MCTNGNRDVTVTATGAARQDLRHGYAMTLPKASPSTRRLRPCAVEEGVRTACRQQVLHHYCTGRGSSRSVACREPKIRRSWPLIATSLMLASRRCM